MTEETTEARIRRRLTPKQLARFEAKYAVDPSGCWLWTGGTARKGYGRVCVDYVMYSAHRVSYEHHVGAIPKGHYVCHHCDTPACVNPAHLFTGTPQENQTDKVRKMRQGTARGERSNFARLTRSQVLKIRRQLAAGDRVTHIAKRFGVGHGAIQRIRDRETWAHV